MDKLTATVAIITKDRPDLIARLFESLTLQTLAPDEVLVVDNNSTASYVEVFARFTDRLPLRVVVEKTPGIPAARNRAVQEVQTDLILFVDDDCEAEPQWLEKVVEPFYRDPHIGAVGGPIISSQPSTLAEEFYWSERGGDRQA